ncbi:unnamed protein product [Bursaphelenchus xylophilus]|uniref:(pine wood nematode) hypothetical protein n=1 Tax=Bursaphelenchus xylophilus TaxID=6326 RepID=A0A1I7SVZ9_BURXY|nr:unnamed protein product [Bursaphelenchus xylophilus]CAG9098574.1 unnamed protein product [Bursaphelenchus xylophilus]
MDNTLVFSSFATLNTVRIPEEKIGYGSCRNVDEFEKVDLCGEGSYGIVWKGREIKTGKEFALKKLRLSPNEEVNISVIREIFALKSVKHDNIVKLFDVAVGKRSRKIFLVMEYCDMDLAFMLNKMSFPFTESQTKCLLLQLFEALEYLHANHFIHRDIKLSNILITGQGILKVADFGLARLFGDPPVAMTNQVVTLWYRAPELLLNSEFHSTGVDMWACGCIMAELLLHKPFLPGESEIEQITKIIAMFGTPNEQIWPGMSRLKLPQGFKFVEQPYNNLKRHFGTYGDQCLDLLYKLFAYDPKKRATAAECILHNYFDTSPLPCSPELMPTLRSLLKGRRTR